MGNNVDLISIKKKQNEFQSGRFLRGGSMSSGGSSYSGGSYSSYGDGSVGLTFYAILLLIAALLDIAGLCCDTEVRGASDTSSNHLHHVNDNNINPTYYDEKFEKMVQRTKNEIENKISVYHEQVVTAHPHSGVYNASFLCSNSRKRYDAMLNINFTREVHNCNGYRISGKGSDVDGETIIEDGFVTYDGNAAWWRERTVTGDFGLQVLSKGRFDFQTRSFSGVWKANTNISGSYISFRASTTNTIAMAYAIPVFESSTLGNSAPLSTAINDDNGVNNSIESLPSSAIHTNVSQNVTRVKASTIMYL